MTVYTASLTEADVAVPVACFGVLFLVALAVAGSLKLSGRHRATEPDEPAAGVPVMRRYVSDAELDAQDWDGWARMAPALPPHEMPPVIPGPDHEEV